MSDAHPDIYTVLTVDHAVMAVVADEKFIATQGFEYRWLRI
jgi:hypothetical protein